MSEAARRRRPRQERSRTRVDGVLDAALQLIVETGAENLAMREVARRAGIPISSIYQYFPSKSAIIRELAMQNLQTVRELLQWELDRLLVDFKGRPTPAQAVDRLVDAYYNYYRDHPGAVAVWAGAQADPELRRLDGVDARQTAQFLTPPIMIVLSLTDRDTAFALALLMVEATAGVARFALETPPPLGPMIMENLKITLTAGLEARRHPPSPS